jgi:hypothetical protein
MKVRCRWESIKSHFNLFYYFSANFEKIIYTTNDKLTIGPYLFLSCFLRVYLLLMYFRISGGLIRIQKKIPNNPFSYTGHDEIIPRYPPNPVSFA